MKSKLTKYFCTLLCALIGCWAQAHEKIKVIAEEGLSKDEARVVIHLQNGREIIRAISEAQPPMSQQALKKKFCELVAFGAPHCNADELLETLAIFPQMTNVAELMTTTISKT